MPYEKLKVVQPLPAGCWEPLAQVICSYNDLGYRELKTAGNTLSPRYYITNKSIGGRGKTFKINALKSFIAALRQFIQRTRHLEPNSHKKVESGSQSLGPHISRPVPPVLSAD